MKLGFLCANHREWLCSQPDQAMQWCANSFAMAWDLCQREQWQEALPHMGCAFETAGILVTTRAVAPTQAVEWFIRTLAGLTRTLAKLNRTDDYIEVHRVAIDRLRKEVTRKISPDLEARIYLHISRLNNDRKRMVLCGNKTFSLVLPCDIQREAVVFH